MSSMINPNLSICLKRWHFQMLSEKPFYSPLAHIGHSRDARDRERDIQVLLHKKQSLFNNLVSDGNVEHRSGLRGLSFSSFIKHHNAKAFASSRLSKVTLDHKRR